MAVENVGTIYNFNNETSPQTVTVPACTLCVVFGINSTYDPYIRPAQFSTLTLGGTGFAHIAYVQHADGNLTTAYYQTTPSSGSKSFAWAWDDSCDEGPQIWVLFFSGTDTTTPIRGYNSGTASGVTTVQSGSFSTAIGDLCACSGYSWEDTNCNAAPSEAGQTEIADSGGGYNGVWSAVGTKAGSSGTTTMKLSGEAPVILAVSLRASTGNPWYYYAQMAQRIKDKYKKLIRIPSFEEVMAFQPALRRGAR